MIKKNQNQTLGFEVEWNTGKKKIPWCILRKCGIDPLSIMHWFVFNSQPEAKSISTFCAGQRPIANLLSPLSYCLTGLQKVV